MTLTSRLITVFDPIIALVLVDTSISFRTVRLPHSSGTNGREEFCVYQRQRYQRWNAHVGVDIKRFDRNFRTEKRDRQYSRNILAFREISREATMRRRRSVDYSVNPPLSPFPRRDSDRVTELLFYRNYRHRNFWPLPNTLPSTLIIIMRIFYFWKW